MPVYVRKFQGFIADAANIDFERCDGQVYSCSTANASNLTASANALNINGGQSAYPIGFIDTDRGLECSFTNAMFDGDMFEIANNTAAVDADSSTRETKKYAVTSQSSSLQVVLPFEVEPSTIVIRGLEYTSSTSAEGKFTVTYDSESKKTTIGFYTGDVAAGDEIWISYKRRIASAHEVAVKTNSVSAKGSVWMHWPVYSNGTDCTEASVKGYVHVHIFRVRVSAQPSIESSYKTASTHSMTFTAIDPNRADGKMYKVTYEPLTAGGEIDTSYSSGTITYD